MLLCCLVIIFFGSTIFLLASGALLLAGSTELLVELLPATDAATIGLEATTAALFKARLARFGPLATDFAMARALLIERFLTRLGFGDDFLSLSSSLDDDDDEELESRFGLFPRSRCFSFAARFLFFSCDSSLYKDRSTVEFH